MSVDVMHARRVPPIATGFQDRTVFDLDFGVTVCGQFPNFESADIAAVLRHAILRETNQPVIKLYDSARRTGATLVVADDGTLWMFAPWTSQGVSKVKTQRVVLVRSRTDEEPPLIVVVKERGIGKASFQQPGHAGPARREFAGFVQANCAGAESLGEHEEIVFAFEDVGV